MKYTLPFVLCSYMLLFPLLGNCQVHDSPPNTTKTAQRLISSRLHFVQQKNKLNKELKAVAKACKALLQSKQDAYKSNLLDTNLIRKNRMALQQLIRQKAYVNALVESNIEYRRHNKASVVYTIKTGNPLLIHSVAFHSEDAALQSILDDIKHETHLQKYLPVSLANLTSEKKRLTLAIRNRGYYDFNWKYIQIEADTNKMAKSTPYASKAAHLYINVLAYSDSLINHPSYRVCNVFINSATTTASGNQSKSPKDSLYLVERSVHNSKVNLILDNRTNMIEGDKLLHIMFSEQWNDMDKHKLEHISNAIVIKPGDLYSFDATQASLQRIVALKDCRLRQISYVATADKQGCLDCMVKILTK